MIEFFILFLASAIALYFSCELLVKDLIKILTFLKTKEFVVAFFVFAFASTLPNLFLGISSAINKVPDLSLGDIIGNNLISLTLAVALGVFFSKNKEISTDSKTVQSTTLFVLVAAVLPILLAVDHQISRTDGIILILTFILYLSWLFSKKERFQKAYSLNKESQQEIPTISKTISQFSNLVKKVVRIVFLIAIIFIIAQLIVFSVQKISLKMGTSLIFFGLIITGLTNALPEIYFSIDTAKKEENWMILGSLMGSVVFLATLTLGLIALIHPISIVEINSLVLARFFMILITVLFFIFARSEKKISKKEAAFLLLVYFLYVAFEIIRQMII